MATSVLGMSISTEDVGWTGHVYSGALWVGVPDLCLRWSVNWSAGNLEVSVVPENSGGGSVSEVSCYSITVAIGVVGMAPADGCVYMMNMATYA